MMADITYCINASCPFKDCERHSEKIKDAATSGKGYVSVSDWGGTCRRYISYIAEEVLAGGKKEHIAGR